MTLREFFDQCGTSKDEELELILFLGTIRLKHLLDVLVGSNRLLTGKNRSNSLEPARTGGGHTSEIPSNRAESAEPLEVRPQRRAEERRK